MGEVVDATEHAIRAVAVVGAYSKCYTGEVAIVSRHIVACSDEYAIGKPMTVGGTPARFRTMGSFGQGVAVECAVTHLSRNNRLKAVRATG